MAIYHLHCKIISRGKGQSVVASAAYRAAEKLELERENLCFDYSRKQNVDYENIFLPESAPVEFYDRETLWNAVEDSENRKDARLAREIEIALPREFSLEQQRHLVSDFVQEEFVDRGMIADVAIHKSDFKHQNPHAHILLTTRDVDEEGFGLKNTEWNKKEMLLEWRQNWERTQNLALEREGFDMRVDCRTLEQQGIDREPQIHMGVKSHHMEMKEWQRIQQLNLSRDQEHQIEYRPITQRGQELQRIQQLNESRQELSKILGLQRKLEINQNHKIQHNREPFRRRTHEFSLEQQFEVKQEQKLKQSLEREPQHQQGVKQNRELSIDPAYIESHREEQEIEGVNTIKSISPQQEQTQKVEIAFKPDKEINQEHQIEEKPFFENEEAQLEIKVTGASSCRPANQQEIEEVPDSENEVEQQLTDLQKRELELTQKIAEFKLQGKDQDCVERAKCGFSQLEFDLNKIYEQKQVLRDAGWSEERIDQIENTFDLDHYSFEEQQKNNDWQYKQEPEFSYEYEPEQLDEAREILSDNGWTYDEIYELDDDELMFEKEQIEQNMDFGWEL